MPRNRKRHKRRVRPPTHIKVRVKITAPQIRKSEAVKLLNKAIRTGFVPRGIELAWMDWESGEGGYWREGSYVGQDARDALVKFRAALQHPNTSTRIEIVDED